MKEFESFQNTTRTRYFPLRRFVNENLRVCFLLLFQKWDFLIPGCARSHTHTLNKNEMFQITDIIEWFSH